MKVTKQNKGNVGNFKEMGAEDMHDQEKESSMNEEREHSYKGYQMEKIDFNKDDKKKLLAQVQKEYKFSTRELKSWIDKNLRRLKLYNNQTRKEEHVGEPLIYTHIDTWLASLYDDRMDMQFIPREEGDIKTAENTTKVAEYDYELMDMEDVDREQEWDALFFGYGLVDWLEFDSVKKCPAPYVLDPLCFYYDTLGNSIDGNVAGKSGFRFLGWDMFLSAKEIEANPLLGEEAIKLMKGNKGDDNSNKTKARRERMIALGGDYSQMDDDLNNNTIYQVVQWRTFWDGKRIVVMLSPDLKEVLGATFLPEYEDEDGNTASTWWVSCKRFSPMSHQFKGVSLPDLLEDKQRKKAELLNDTLKLARATVFGNYAYDKTKIDNNVDLGFGYDKWIPVNGDPASAIRPVQKDVPFTGLMDNMLNYLDVSAQKASATSEMTQGILSKDNRTASELNLMAQMTQIRYSLVAKSFASGDRDGLRLWYLSYKINFDEGLGEKIVRIGGVGGYTEYRKVTGKEMICKIDPDIKVESTDLARAKKQREFGMVSQVAEITLQDKDADKRGLEKHLYYLAGVDQDTIDMILPPTTDELIARDQNEMINAGKKPPILPNDNHLVHIREHRRAIENPIKKAHIEAHYQALRLIQANPALQPTANEAGMQTGETAPVPAEGAGANSPVPVAPSPSQEATLNNQAMQ